MVCRNPVQPLLDCSACPCDSCPSTNVTVTSLQLTTPSSGSVTVTLYCRVSPKENRPPSSGPDTTIVGLVLPAVMIVLVAVRLPDESITVRTAGKRPGLV